MYRFIWQTALIAALALPRHRGVAAESTAASDALLHEQPIAVAKTHGMLSKTHDGLYARLRSPQTLESLKQKAARHLSEFGQEMQATQGARRCKVESVGSGHGVHSLCAELKPQISSSSPCIFYSYGISHGYSFDTAMADQWGCKDVALDPSVTYSSKLLPKVTFHNMRALKFLCRNYRANEQTKTISRSFVLREILSQTNPAGLPDSSRDEAALALHIPFRFR
jgi:hypothetical protein